MQYQPAGDHPDDCVKDFPTLFKDEYKKYLDSSMRYSSYGDGTGALKLGQTRGKVVLIDWFDKDDSNKSATLGGTEMGFDKVGNENAIENTYEGIMSIGGMGMSAYEKLLEENVKKSQDD